MMKSENEYIQACLRVIKKSVEKAWENQNIKPLTETENYLRKALVDIDWLIEKLKDS